MTATNRNPDRPTKATPPQRRGRDRVARIEPLESRLLLAGDLPSITRVEADNRGLVLLTASRSLLAQTINTSSVRVSVAGDDLLLGTADDQNVAVSEISYDIATRTIRILAPVSANTRYAVRLDASIITGTNGQRLDGEFNGGSTISGDGVQGGDFVFFTRAPAQQVARVTTFAGVIDMDLLGDRAPLTVANFLAYANDGSYDAGFFHRRARSGGLPFVVQGGGFRAADGFPAIPTRPTVRNEFGVSNTRGTVAMAKRDQQPDSATNQFFYNISDNSANLDRQNGGFTVFARVRDAAGLAVMDALDRFDVFNASSQNGVLNEVPVRNLASATSAGRITPNDVITINRIALLVDVGSAPGQQVSTTGALTFTGNAGQTVTILDLNGSGFGSTDFVDVRFGSGGTVSSINFRADFNGSAGVVVTGASRVERITDSRRTTNGTVGLVAIQDGSLGSLSLRGSLIGSNFNGFVVAPGFQLAADIDGDGQTNDSAAIVAPGTGATSLIDIRGDLTGSVTLGGSLARLNAEGFVNHADIRTGGDANVLARYNLGAADNSSINTAQRVDSIRAVNWRVSETTRKTIAAPTLGRLEITGDRQHAGVFEAQLTLTGPQQGAPSGTRTLTSATVAGGVFDSTWTITGNVGTIDLGPTARRWTLNVTGEVTSVVLGRAEASAMTVSGAVGTFRVAEWFTGQARAARYGNVVVRAERGGDGSFQGTLSTSASDGVAIARGSIFNLRNGGTIDAAANIQNLTITQATDATVTARTVITSLRMGEITNTNINAQTGAQFISIARWNGGNLAGGTFTRLNVGGDASFNATGSLDALLNFNVNGNYTGSITTRGGFNWRFSRNVTDSNFSLTFANTFSSLRTLSIGGNMVNSNFRAVRNVDSVTIGRMDNSGLYVGAPTNQVGLPANAANTNDSVRIGLLKIGSTGESFTNSFVVTGRLLNATISGPTQSNNGTTHGLAANRINKVTVLAGRIARVFDNPQQSITNLGDFRIQINPAAPTA